MTNVSPYSEYFHPDYIWASSFMGKIITLNGPFGVGKTTLGHALVAWYKSVGIERAVFFPETVDMALLEKYIHFNKVHRDAANPHAYPFQMDMLQRRIDTHIHAISLARQGWVVITDRSPSGDRVFAQMQIDKGNFDERQEQTYFERLGELDLLYPTISLYLETHPRVAMERTRVRDRAGEDEYCYQDFVDIHNAHVDHFIRTEENLIKLDWNAAKIISTESQRILDPRVALQVAFTMYNKIFPRPSSLAVRGLTTECVLEDIERVVDSE